MHVEQTPECQVLFNLLPGGLVLGLDVDNFSRPHWLLQRFWNRAFRIEACHGAHCGQTEMAVATGLPLGMAALAASISGFARPAASAAARVLPAAGGTVSSAVIATPEASIGGTPNNLCRTMAKTTPTSFLWGLSLRLSWFGRFAFPKYKVQAHHPNPGRRLWIDLGYCSFFNCGQRTLVMSVLAANTVKKSGRWGTRWEDNKALKDENLPHVVCQGMENLEKAVKEQKIFTKRKC